MKEEHRDRITEAFTGNINSGFAFTVIIELLEEITEQLKEMSNK